MYDPDEQERRSYCEKLLGIYTENQEFWNNYLSLTPEEITLITEEDDEAFAEIIEEGLLRDAGLRGSEFFTRKLDNYHVSYTPVDIILEDVTLKF